MNRMIRGMAGLLVALGASACVTDPSVDYANDPSTIVLDPEVMFVTHGTEKQMFARLVDERNRATPTEFQISNIGAGLTVRVDSQYRVDYINGDSLSWRPIQHQHRVWVGSSAPTGVMGTFRIASSGISKDVTVRVLPANLGAAVSSANPSIGEVVTVTAPANLSFTDVATVALVDGNTVVNAVVTDRTAKTVSFVPMPGSTGVVRVAGVTLDYAPTLAARTLATTSTVTVPADPASPTLSTVAPTLGVPVTVTAGPGQSFSATAGVTFTPGGAAVVTARTATTLTILPRPGSGGVGTVTGVILTDGEAEVLGTFTRTTSNGFTTPIPAVTTIPLVYSNPTPGPGEAVTVTAAGFKFLPTVAMTIAGRPAGIVGVSADSNTVTLVPAAGLAGEAATVNSGVALSFLTAVPLTNLSSTATLTTGNYAPVVGGTTTDNAVEFNVPAVGTPFWIADGAPTLGAATSFGDGATRYYKIVVSEAGARTFRFWWNNNVDMDLFIRNSTNTASVGTAFTTANPEQISNVTLAPGTYYIAIVQWSGSAGAPPSSVLITVR